MQTLLEERTLPFFSQLLPPFPPPPYLFRCRNPMCQFTHILSKTPKTFQALFAQQSHFSKALKVCI